MQTRFDEEGYRKRAQVETVMSNQTTTGIVLQRQNILEQMSRIALDGAHTQHHDSVTDSNFSTEPV